MFYSQRKNPNDEILRSIKLFSQGVGSNLYLVILKKGKNDTLPDIDLLVVGSKSIKDELDEFLDSLFFKYSKPVSLSFFTPEQYARMKDHPIIKRYQEQGIILYERK